MTLPEGSPARRRLMMVPKTAARVAEGEDDRDHPARVLRQDVVGDVVDLLVLDPDHALRPERLQDHSLPDEQAGERDHEGRHAEEGDERSLGRSDRTAYRERGKDRDQARVLVTRARQLQLGNDDARDAADVADREVDLADQEHEDDADRDDGHARHLLDQVREVDRAEEDAGLRGEEDGDRDQADDHRQAADFTCPERVPAGPQDPAEARVLAAAATSTGPRKLR